MPSLLLSEKAILETMNDSQIAIPVEEFTDNCSVTKTVEEVREFDTFDVLGIPISVTTLETAEHALVRWAKDRVGRFVCVREVASLMAMIDDPDLVNLNKQSAMNIPDGMPLVWIGKFRGLPVERTCGPDLMDRVCSASPRTGLKHFFYGGKEGVADKLADVFRKKVPDIEIVGTYCPPFRPLTEDEDLAVTELIRNSGADLVWIGISSPRQDIWMQQHFKKLPQTLIGVGAAFDFHSGAVPRAPKWMQTTGLEWVYRLIQEPKRLWKRYLFDAPRFVLRLALRKHSC